MKTFIYYFYGISNRIIRTDLGVWVCLEQCIQQNYRSPTILFRGAPRRGRATCSRFQGPRILDIVPPKAEPRHCAAGTRCSTMTPEGGTRCSTTRPSTPRRGVRHLVALTLYVVRGTRTVAQDVVSPRRGLRHYATLTQDIVC